MRKSIVMSSGLVLSALLLIAGCSELGINNNNNDQGIVLTLNVSSPPYYNFSGKTIRASLWSNWGDETPYKVKDVVASGTSATIQVTNINVGTYIVVVAVDRGQNGFSDAPVESGDLFWAALDVTINSSVTINWPAYAWQSFDSFVFGIKGIPSGNNGKVCAMGLFEPNTDVFNNLPEGTPGGASLIYNNCAVIAINPPSGAQWDTWELPYGEYDIWALVDVDGTPESWFDEVEDGNPITTGDYIYSNLGWTYNNSMDENATLLNANFVLYQPITVSFNLSFRDNDNLDGHEVLLSLWDGLDAENDIKYLKVLTVEGSTATGELNLISPDTLHIFLIADKTGDGIMGPTSPLDQGDLLWGALRVPITTNRTVTVQPQWWQTAHSLIFLIDNLPSGCEGKVASMGIFDDGANPFRRNEVQSYLGGGAAVYNRSAIICPTPHDWDPQYSLPNGSYDVYSLIDMDGTFDDYETPGYNPISQGDYACKFDLTYVDNPEDIMEPFEFHGSYTPMVGVGGTVTCPTWTPSQGNIYLYLFATNPLFDSAAENLSMTFIEQPGNYWIPYFPDSTVFVVGFWDADNSGEENGPTQNDMIGGYGAPPIDSLEPILVLPLTGATDADFELSIPYDSTQFGGN